MGQQRESTKLVEPSKGWLPFHDPPQLPGALGLLPMQKCIFFPRQGKGQSVGSQFTVEFSPSTENGPTFTHTVEMSEQLGTDGRVRAVGSLGSEFTDVQCLF